MNNLYKRISYPTVLKTATAKTEQHVIDNLKVKIGLEIHARILSKTKIFSDSRCYEQNNSLPNSNVSNFDIALPGTMPMLNKRCVEASLLTALALKCKINGISRFERKHYFYADLPAGYQITQQRKPIAFSGSFKYPKINPKTHKLTYKNCNIRQVQLEHDSARSLKTESLSLRFNDKEKLPNDSTLIDHNRTGLALMEIVTEPDFETAFDSYSFVRELALTLKSLGTCSADMTQGEFRVDVNVSCHRTDPLTNQALPGVRVELKNLNSFSAVLKATEIEIKRQKSLINSGKIVLRETRTYDSVLNKTVAIRTKEDQYDYRFMPEPNLLPLVVYPSKSFKLNQLKCLNNEQLVIDEEYLIKIKSGNYADLDLVKQDYENKILPQQRRDFIKEKYDLTDEICFIFIANDLDKLLIEILDTDSLNKDILVKVLLNEYLNQVNTNFDLDKFNFELKCLKIKSYVDLITKKLISKRIFYKFFARLFHIENMNKMALELAAEKKLFLIDDPTVISETIQKLFDSNPKALKDFKTKMNKREKVFDFFVGRVHKELNDLADQELVDQIVKKNLEKI